MSENKEKTAVVAVSAMTQLEDRAAGRRRVTVRAFLAMVAEFVRHGMKRKPPLKIIHLLEGHVTALRGISGAPESIPPTQLSRRLGC
jgi:hypothetical protein